MIIKEEHPKVTIVTITYNLIKAGRTDSFKQAVESVHRQNYDNIEHIIIDGASTDGSKELIEEYVKKKWVICFSEPDKGIYDAMNKGIQKASGEYIAFLNSDDYYHKDDGVFSCVKKLTTSKADYCYADTAVLFPDGSHGVWKADLNLIAAAKNYCHQTMFAKTSLLRDMGGFDLKYKISADSDMMIRLLARKAKAVKVENCFVTYRGDGASSQQRELSRKEHSTSFYQHIGKSLGLSEKDCYDLWNHSFLTSHSLEQQITLVSKLKVSEWIAAFVKEIINFNFINNITNPLPIEYKITCLKFPLIKIKKKQAGTKLYLFGVPVLKIKHKKYVG